MIDRAAASRALWADPEWRAKTIAARNAAGRQHKPESIAKISASLIGRSKSPETLARMSRARRAYIQANPAAAVAAAARGGRSHRGRNWSIAARLKLSQSRRGKPSPARGHRHSPELRVAIGKKVALTKAAASLLGIKTKGRIKSREAV